LEVTIKFYLYQLLAVFIIWLGMTFFLDKMYDSGKIIYYMVTGWFIFLLFSTLRRWLSDRRKKQ